MGISKMESANKFVQCRSIRSVNEIQNGILLKIEEVIKANTFWTEEEKCRVRERFREVGEPTALVRSEFFE